nr:hypothetical protein StreXyl84_78940 [Streptomyces sp. Xyl84]
MDDAAQHFAARRRPANTRRASVRWAARPGIRAAGGTGTVWEMALGHAQEIAA